MAKRKPFDTDLIFIGIVAMLLSIVLLVLNNYVLSGERLIVIGIPFFIGVALLAKGFNLERNRK
ncbi:MAG: hypothetical protein J7K68_00495 [Candidatus Diapherotrites archaeon]|nr:hypothetical protein [Candidatus Diapherotrites archaeon]